MSKILAGDLVWFRPKVIVSRGFLNPGDPMDLSNHDFSKKYAIWFVGFRMWNPENFDSFMTEASKSHLTLSKSCIRIVNSKSLQYIQIVNWMWVFEKKIVAKLVALLQKYNLKNNLNYFLFSQTRKEGRKKGKVKVKKGYLIFLRSPDLNESFA